MDLILQAILLLPLFGAGVQALVALVNITRAEPISATGVRGSLGGGFSIASQDLQTRDFRLLSQSALDESPTVAPNGAMVMYTTKRGGRSVLAVVSIDDGTRFVLPASASDVREPAWSPFLR